MDVGEGVEGGCWVVAHEPRRSAHEGTQPHCVLGDQFYLRYLYPTGGYIGVSCMYVQY